MAAKGRVVLVSQLALAVVVLAATQPPEVGGSVAAPVERAHDYADPHPEPQVIGGRNASLGEWPWMAAIYLREALNSDWEFACGGALIDPEWVITSASCIWDPPGHAPLPAAMVQVALGVQDLVADTPVLVDAAQIVAAPQFRFTIGLLGADYALIRLSRPIDSTFTIQPIELIESADDPALRPGRSAMVAGWGSTNMLNRRLTTALQEAEVTIMDCGDSPIGVSNSEVCTTEEFGSGTSFGDEGSPLMVLSQHRWHLAGVALRDAGDNGEYVTASLFTSAGRIVPWLRRTMDNRKPMMELGIEAPFSIPERGTLRYNLTLRNTGRRTTQPVVLRNHIPDGVRFVSASGGAAPESGALSWRVGEMLPGDEYTVSYDVREEPTVRTGRPEAGARRIFPSRQPDGTRAALGTAPGTAPGAAPSRAPEPGQPQVVGGEDARTGAWPWHAMLGDPESPECGASLISDRWVLTAAHCVVPFGMGYHPEIVYSDGGPFVTLGLTSQRDRSATTYAAEATYVHGGWAMGQVFDIALIKLAEPVEFSYSVRPVLLDGIQTTDLSAPGATGIVTGWGMVSMINYRQPATLQQGSLPILDPDLCPAYSGNRRDVCAGPLEGGISACYGDSGGPFVMETDSGWTQVGVVSRGSNWYCAARGNPTVFTGVPYYRSWIAHKMATEVEDKIIVNAAAWADGLKDGSETVVSVGLTMVEPAPLGALPTPLPPRDPLVEQVSLPLIGR